MKPQLLNSFYEYLAPLRTWGTGISPSIFVRAKWRNWVHSLGPRKELSRSLCLVLSWWTSHTLMMLSSPAPSDMRKWMWYYSPLFRSASTGIESFLRFFQCFSMTWRYIQVDHVFLSINVSPFPSVVWQNEEMDVVSQPTVSKCFYGNQ
jgi:hypothetical protein